MKEELQKAIDLALRSGEILLRHYAGEPVFEWKAKNDPVTAADRAVSRFIVDELRASFPDDAILSEEEKDDASRTSNPRVWVIDPMDGTKEFIARRGEFAVMIGLAIRGESLLGAVYQPTLDKLYYAASGEGAYLREKGSERRLHVSATTAMSDATMALSRSHFQGKTEVIRRRLGISRTIQTGSLGLKVGLICEGLAEVYVQGRGTSLWDTCGPEAILREAGGRMTDSRGQPIRYDVTETRNRNGVVATNGQLHQAVLHAIS